MFMRHRLMRWTALCMLLAGVLTLTACNTIHGFGKDVERGGQKIQESTGQQTQQW